MFFSLPNSSNLSVLISIFVCVLLIKSKYRNGGARREAGVASEAASYHILRDPGTFCMTKILTHKTLIFVFQ